SESKALLLATRERVVPRCLLVKAIDQMIETHMAKCRLDVFSTAAFGGVWIVCGAAQCAGRHVGALRQKEYASAATNLDAASAPRPQPGNGADQCALSRAGFARDQHPLSAHDGDFSLVDDRGAIIECDREIMQSQLRRSL